MKEFNENMTSIELRRAYFEVILDEKRTKEEKEEAKAEYDRLMKLLMLSPEMVMA